MTRSPEEMNLNELLQRWYELEPATYQAQIKDTIVPVGPSGTISARIQWAVQEAITRRGWYFALTYHPELNEFRAETGSSQPSPLVFRAKNPAEALLRAYISQLTNPDNAPGL